MATKKKTKKAAKKKPAKAAKKSSKKIAKKVTKKIVAKKISGPQKPSKPLAKVARVAKAPAKPVRARGKQDNVETVTFEPAGLGARSGGQSGDLQGLTNRAGADSESVDELLEEGNAFEAEVVKGIEDVPDADEGEIRTHEVPEDDVPGEYDDQ